MESKKQSSTGREKNLCNSPLVLNTVFGLILMGLEKLVDLEFECPCNPRWNGLFSSAFFIVPAIMAFTVMLIIQRCRCDGKCDLSRWITLSLPSFVPAMVWLILMFLNGRYFACAMTDWEGRYVRVDKAAPQKWCEPTSEGDVTLQQRLFITQEWFFTSQVIGIFLLIFICVGLVESVIRESRQKKVEMQDSDAARLTVFG